MSELDFAVEVIHSLYFVLRFCVPVGKMRTGGLVLIGEWVAEEPVRGGVLIKAQGFPTYPVLVLK